MLGRRNPQRSLFDANGLPHRVSPDSFYGRMAAVIDLLFADDDLKEMYDSCNGRPSLPPSLMSGVLLLQFFDDVSDHEATERVLYDLRWKIALHLPLDCSGFDPSSLSYFRKRLVEHGHERYAFDRFIAVGRQAGFLPDRVTLLVDTTWVKGAGAVQNTYTLLRKGIRQLLQTLGYATPGKRHGLSSPIQQLVSRYLDRDHKAEIDWSDPVERTAQLKMLVEDAQTALDWALAQSDDAEVRATGWLLTKILGDDVATNEHGEPQLGGEVAPDRVISLTDPEMRHGHKSPAQRFDGFKTAVATDLESELILDVADLSAGSGDGQHLQPTIQRIEARTDLSVERIIGDGAYPSGANLAACALHAPQSVDLVAPLRPIVDRMVDRSAFQIDLTARLATCPNGCTAKGKKEYSHGRHRALRFQFERVACEGCQWFSRCVQGKVTGRSLKIDEYEPYRRAARQRQNTPEFKALYRLRNAIERKQAELVRHGWRRTRYLGRTKRELQRLWIAAGVNLKRLFRLSEQRGSELSLLLVPVG